MTVDRKQSPHIEEAIEKYRSEKPPYDIPGCLELVERFIDDHIPKDAFSNLDVMFIQHHLGPFVPRLKAMMKRGLDLSRCWFVDIPYSTNERVRVAIKGMGCIEKQMVPLFNDPLAPYSKSQLERVVSIVKLLDKKSDKRLLVVDDGAYFLRALDHMMSLDPGFIKRFRDRGVHLVEQTTRGQRYVESPEIGNLLKLLGAPLVSIAKVSTKKKLESPFIGASISKSFHKMMNSEVGPSVDLGQVLIIGFGDVGASTAGALAKYVYEKIDVYDPKCAELYNKIERLGCNTLRQFPKEGCYNTVFGCTGKASFPLDSVGILDDNALLVSGSSAAVEFNREGFIERANANEIDEFYVMNPESTRMGGIHSAIRLHKDDKEFTFMNAGFPINFDGELECLPHEIIQITHSLLVAASYQTLNSPPGFYMLRDKYDQWITEKGVEAVADYVSK